MAQEDKDWAAFEKYLFSFMNEDTPRIPLTNDEVIAILESYGPPAEVSEEAEERVVKLMKTAYERRKGNFNVPEQFNS